MRNEAMCKGVNSNKPIVGLCLVYLLLPAILLIFPSLSMCADPPPGYTYQTYIEDVPLGSMKSASPTGKFNSMMIFLADQLQRNMDVVDFNSHVIVTSFSNLDNLKEINRLGRLISENLMHELQVRRWLVYDIRLMNDIVMNENGEFSLSHDIKKIRERYDISAIVTGTYSITTDNVIVNARMINAATGVVISSGQVAIPYNGMEDMLRNYSQKKTMLIKGDPGEK